MRRRDFIKVIVGSAATWPFAPLAQQGEHMRRIGVLMNLAPDDPESQRRITALIQGLQQLGWTDGRNVQIETRWTNAEHARRDAEELIALTPDVILASGGTTLRPLREATRRVPIVFVIVPDPVGAGFVASLARPGGNATGFTSIEYGMSGKWLELLKQIAPHVTKVAVLRDPSNPSGIGQWGAIQSVAGSFGVELRPIDFRDADEIKSAVTDFSHEPNGGLIVTTSVMGISHRDLIIMLAAQYHLPAVYPYRIFVNAGGLISYGPDYTDQFRRAAGYIDRILKGATPAELPVEQPTKYELVINLKSAKGLGLTIPQSLIASADEVIE